MDAQEIPAHPNLEQYRKQAKELVKACQSGDAAALKRVARQSHRPNPRPVALTDAQFTIAREYAFESWPKFVQHVEALNRERSPISQFEAAADAVVNGDMLELARLLRENPALAVERSTRFHGATLLHYVAANGVEDYRQKSPANAAAIARFLLEAGAEVEALADAYGTRCNTLSLLLSSAHPAKAGVQIELANVLLDHGADIERGGTHQWGTPLMIALAFGYLDAALALAQRGAMVDNIAATAGLGWLAETANLLPTSDSESRHRALALAAQHGHWAIVRLLLDAGEDPNRYNPANNHAHSTPLHQAVFHGHYEVVKLLVERGARLDLKDTIYQGTPLGWALHAGHSEIADFLRASDKTSQK